MFRIDPRTRYGGHAAHHVFRLDRPNVSLRVDRVETNEKLVRFAVNHSVGVRSPNAFGTNRLMKRGVDFIKLVGGTVRQVRAVSNHPKAIRPRDDGSRAALPFVVIIR